MQIDRTNGDLENTRRDLMALRVKHGPTSSVGHHLSNLLELIDLPTPPAFQLKQQIRGLQRAMAGE